MIYKGPTFLDVMFSLSPDLENKWNKSYNVENLIIPKLIIHIKAYTPPPSFSLLFFWPFLAA